MKWIFASVALTFAAPLVVESCKTFEWPTRENALIWAERRVGRMFTSDPDANALQFCKEEGYAMVDGMVFDRECEHTGGDSNDESGYSAWDGNSWSFLSTPSSNRCYVMYKSITCCDDCQTFDFPKRNGDDLIWAEVRTYSSISLGTITTDPEANALKFCQEEGYAFVGGTLGDTACEHNGGEVNDESGGYTTWHVDSWVSVPTPSANRCYVMYKSITCCHSCGTTFDFPKRNDDLIWAEVRTYSSITLGTITTDPQVNALQFCQEEGFALVGNTVGDTMCEHTGGDDNDESGYSSWHVDSWVYVPTPSSNRCYVMFKSITCCDACGTTFNFPERNVDDLIWAEERTYSSISLGTITTNPQVNALQFCQEEGFALVATTVGDSACEHNGGEVNDESGGYTSFHGGSWVSVPTPSSNRCYVMFKSITCCGSCRVFVFPKRNVDDLIWAEERTYTSITLGTITTNPEVNALQFCEEEGYTLVGATVGDVDCEHNGGEVNDESGGYTSWHMGSWVSVPTPSSNRCYVMFKTITCCIVEEEEDDDNDDDEPVGPILAASGARSRCDKSLQKAVKKYVACWEKANDNEKRIKKCGKKFRRSHDKARVRSEKKFPEEMPCVDVPSSPIAEAVLKDCLEQQAMKSMREDEDCEEAALKFIRSGSL